LVETRVNARAIAAFRKVPAGRFGVRDGSKTHPSERENMTKLVSSLVAALFAVATFGVAHAASHTGGAPMKASEPAAKASGAMKKDEKKEEPKK
jgi:hypothetical protein